ncbi:hypothetical protein PG994_008841 [Apiospora phragmitis]|uniref:Uncharacterized protein n=1 Tax=Apiospora phragmitis TaxID=2905665 RepID=A0ABR1UHK9_9PEZI
MEPSWRPLSPPPLRPQTYPPSARTGTPSAPRRPPGSPRSRRPRRRRPWPPHDPRPHGRRQTGRHAPVRPVVRLELAPVLQQSPAAVLPLDLLAAPHAGHEASGHDA